MRRPTMTAAVLVTALALSAAGCSSKAKDDEKEPKGADVKMSDGVTESTIPLGVLTDMTGIYATLGKSVTQAQQLYVKQINAAGGICDRKIELTIKDHGYNAQRAISAYSELEPKVLGFPQFIGSPYVAAVKARIDGQDKGLVIPQAWSANLLGSDSIRQIGATYDYEMINAVDFLVREKGLAKGDKVGHVYFEGDFGENAVAGSKHAAKAAGLSIVEQKIKPADEDMTAQVTALRKAGVKAMLISAGPKQTASLVGVAAASKLAVPVVGSNPTFAPQLLGTQAAPALLANFYFMASTLPIGSEEEGPAKLAADYEKEYPGDLLDNGIVAGWAAADVYGEALKKACEAKNLTREGVTEALLSISGYDTGFGIKHDFTDPTVPSTKESYVLRPDDKAKGSMTVVGDVFTAEATESYTPATG